MAAKILFLDIETFPNVAYVWGKYQQDVIRFKQQTCIATYAAKWHNGPVFAKSLLDYRGYRPGSYDDKQLVTDLWRLFDEADIIVAHNGKSFDTKVCLGRFMVHGLKPPSPFKQVDTKEVASKLARFNSNKLDDLGQLFSFGKKIKTDFDLWHGCINGEKASWAKMIKYNKMDVLLLEKLYNRLLPWISSHPSMAVLLRTDACPKCGAQKLQKRGEYATNTGVYPRLRCMSCGGWSRGTKREFKVNVTNVS